MNENTIPEIKVYRLDELPVTFAIIQELEISATLDRLSPRHLNWVGDLSFGQVVTGWLAFILSTGDHRLNHVEDWVKLRLDIYAACLQCCVRAFDFSDDRLADILDKLNQAKLWSEFELELNRRIIRVYHLEADFIRLDSTTISTYTAVNPDGLLQLGYSKDRRPQDAQLKIQLATLDPLGIPIVTQVVAGNSADDPLYLPAIAQVQACLGTGGKTYIGDAKMGALNTRAALAKGRDYYLCPLCEKQLPTAQRQALIRAVLRGKVKLTPIKRERRNPLTGDLISTEKIASGYEVSVRLTAMVEGRTVRWKERRLVVRSLAYAKSETAHLEKRLKRAQTELRNLVVRKQGKRRLDARQTEQAAEQILARYRVKELLSVTISAQTLKREVRGYQDRPTRTLEEDKVTIQVRRCSQQIKAVKEQMGWRIYVTNHPSLSLGAAVLAYREQFRIEDGISRLKGRPLGLSPMFLQTEPRMVGLINLLTIALRLLTLIEFRVRRGLRAEGKPITGLYAGQKGRQTLRPSAELLLEAFQEVNAVVGIVNERPLSYLQPLTATQQRVLSLLELDSHLYERLLSKFPISKSASNVSEP
jgi:transposase